MTGPGGLAKGCHLVTRRERIVLPTDPDYPERLSRVSNPPQYLHVLGDFPQHQGAVAIVGARAASGHATAAARELAAELAAQETLIVSGGAVGVDAAAHSGALEVGGPTVAVLGGGLGDGGGDWYPARNRPLFEILLERGGALISPFERGTAPRPGCFVRRNRVIAGLVDAVVVMEAGPSSGALHTAAAALEYGRVVAALPGSPGTEALIAQGAAVVTDAADLMDALDGRPRRPELVLPERGSYEDKVLAVLNEAPASTEILAERTGLGAGALARALTGLELEGLALLLPGRNYVRSTLAQELMAQ